jgi:hypothetical protein
VDETVSVNPLEHCRILRRRQGAGCRAIEKLRQNPEEPAEPAKTTEVMTFRGPVQRVSKPKPAYRQKLTGDKRPLGLFY